MRLVGIRVGRLFWEATGGAKGDRSIGSNLTTTSDPSPETFAFEAFSSLPARALLAMAIRSPPPEKAPVRPFRSRVFFTPIPRLRVGVVDAHFAGPPTTLTSVLPLESAAPHVGSCCSGGPCRSWPVSCHGSPCVMPWQSDGQLRDPCDTRFAAKDRDAT